MVQKKFKNLKIWSSVTFNDSKNQILYNCIIKEKKGCEHVWWITLYIIRCQYIYNVHRLRARGRCSFTRYSVSNSNAFIIILYYLLYILHIKSKNLPLTDHYFLKINIIVYIFYRDLVYIAHNVYLNNKKPYKHMHI